MPELDCHTLLMELSEYIEGAMPKAACAEMERHIAGCGNCRIVVDTFRRTITLYQRIPRPDMPDDARERLYKTLHLSDYYSPPD
jgi:RNA polymerase sigma-70 factor (ECF subfamily)